MITCIVYCVHWSNLSYNMVMRPVPVASSSAIVIQKNACRVDRMNTWWLPSLVLGMWWSGSKQQVKTQQE